MEPQLSSDLIRVASEWSEIVVTLRSDAEAEERRVTVRAGDCVHDVVLSAYTLTPQELAAVTFGPDEVLPGLSFADCGIDDGARLAITTRSATIKLSIDIVVGGSQLNKPVLVEMGLHETLKDLQSVFTQPERWQQGCLYNQGDPFEMDYEWRLIWRGKEHFGLRPTGERRTGHEPFPAQKTALSELRGSDGQCLADFCSDVSDHLSNVGNSEADRKMILLGSPVIGYSRHA